MSSIYQQFHDAIEANAQNCEVLVIGSNDAVGTSRWRIPSNVDRKLRFDALAQADSEIEQAIVHSHSGILTFFEVDTGVTPPSDWIRGISSLKPERNALDLRSGNQEERKFIASHMIRRQAPLTPVRELGSAGVPKYFMLDIEGLDYDVTLDLLGDPHVLGVGCEHALMTSEEVILLRCAAVENGFRFVFGEEDAVFLRMDR